MHSQPAEENKSVGTRERCKKHALSALHLGSIAVPPPSIPPLDLAVGELVGVRVAAVVDPPDLLELPGELVRCNCTLGERVDEVLGQSVVV